MSSTDPSTPKEVCPLTLAHQQVLAARAIPLEAAVAAGLRSVDLGAEKRSMQAHKAKRPFPGLPLVPVTGILIPYPETLDRVRRWRVRCDQDSYETEEPMPGVRGHTETIKVPRYLCQAKLGVVPYVTKEACAAAADVSVPLHVVEAPLKAICLSASGFPAIGLGGVLAGTHDKSALAQVDEVVAHPELKRLRWKGRRVYIVFDAGCARGDNYEGNPLVAIGAARVWKALADLGADVRLVTVPYYHAQESDPENGTIWKETDQGPDDFIARNGMEAFQKLIAQAVAADPKTRATSKLEGIEVAARPDAINEVLEDLFFTATLATASNAKLAAVAAVTKKAGIGVRDLRAAAAEFEERVVRRQQRDEPDWKRRIVCARGGLPRPIGQNVELALRRDPQLAGMVGFDEFGQAITFTRPPPWVEDYAAAKDVKVGDMWADADDTRLAHWLGEHHQIYDVNDKKLRAAIVVVARDHAYHPVQQNLTNLKWDDTARVNTWLSRYLGVKPSEYASKIGRWWLISAVARVMQPGCKVDHTYRIIQGIKAVLTDPASPPHNTLHSDYSQLVELFLDTCELDGQPASLGDVLTGELGADLAWLVNHTGPLPAARHPGVPALGASPLPPPKPPLKPTVRPPATPPEPDEWRDLALGMQGDDVFAWQLQLQKDGYSLAPWGADKVFGKTTQNATVSWQKDRGLPGTGVVDERTRALIGTAPVSRPPVVPTLPSQIRFVQAKNFTPANRTSVDVVVIHTMEAPEASTTAENVSAWAAGPNAPQASWHYAIDDDSIVQCVKETDIAWAAPSRNRNGIQLEHAGYARQSAAEWADSFSARMLARSALLTADICRRWNIPVEFVDAAALLAGKRGITTHWEVTKGPGKGLTTHVDPGPNFPMDRYLEQVRNAESSSDAIA